MLDRKAIMNENDQTTTGALQVYEPAIDAVYSIEAVVRIAQTDCHRIAVYCRYGLISPIGSPERDGWCFAGDAIRMLRGYEYLAAESGLSPGGLKLVARLLSEIETLRNRL